MVPANSAGHNIEYVGYFGYWFATFAGLLLNYCPGGCCCTFIMWASNIGNNFFGFFCVCVCCPSTYFTHLVVYIFQSLDKLKFIFLARNLTVFLTAFSPFPAVFSKAPCWTCEQLHFDLSFWMGSVFEVLVSSETCILPLPSRDHISIVTALFWWVKA